MKKELRKSEDANHGSLAFALLKTRGIRNGHIKRNDYNDSGMEGNVVCVRKTALAKSNKTRGGKNINIYSLCI